VKTDAYAYGVVVCEILTGLNPMAKPLPVLISDALEEGELESVLDKKCTWDSAIVHELASIAARCSRVSKLRRKTAQEVLPELEKLHNPNYMPTQLAVGRTYYDPDTGILTQDGSDEESEMHALEEGDGVRDPLLRKCEEEDGLAGEGGVVTRRRWFMILAAFAVGIAGLFLGMHLSHHKPNHTPASTGGCVGQSLTIVGEDCTAWQTLLHSRWFTEANPPACNETQHVADPCSCTGVIGCDAKSGRIVSVDLGSRGLTFKASEDDSLSHLGGLQTLILGVYPLRSDPTNRLRGPLPSWLGALRGSLLHIELQYNRFTGTIDTVSQLTRLAHLDLGDMRNGLNGTLDAVRPLTSLQYLHISGTRLSGPIDPVVHLTKLTHLSLNANQLTGSIDAVKQLALLTFLELDKNRLTGNIAVIKQLTSLEKLYLGSNKFTGSIDAVGQLTDLDTLDLSGNSLNGTIDAVKDLTKLTVLQLDGNRLINSTLDAIHELTALTNLRLGFIAFDDTLEAVARLTSLRFLNMNNLHGPLDALANLKHLTHLDMYSSGNSKKHLTGPIDVIAQLSSLEFLHLGGGGNRLTGKIDAVQGLTNLQEMYLDSNRFTGPIDAVAKLTKLRELYLGANQFSGPIDAISQLTSLTYLSLDDNWNLNGTIRPLAQLTSLSRLMLQGCAFTGSIDALAELTKLTEIQLENNLHQNHGFNGTIDAVAKLTSLNSLDLGMNNHMTGTIGAISKLTSLTYLSLNKNKFSGSINPITKLSELTGLHLDGNDFSGIVPSAMNWTKLSGACDIETNHFACPLPPGAITNCKAACDHKACTGSSADLDDTVCAAWQLTVLPSKYFTMANPPACNDPAHVTDPCACKDVIGCEGGRIVSVTLSDRGLALNVSAEDSLSHLSGLQRLDLSTNCGIHRLCNQLVGPLPVWLEKHADSLTFLDFQGGGKLHGTIGIVAKLHALTTLNLHWNKFTGSIDPVKNLKSLTKLWLWANGFTGSIDAIKDLTSLTVLDLSSNDFSGAVPTGPIDWAKISDCSLALGIENFAVPGINRFACPLPAGAVTNCKAACQVHSWGELAANVGKVPSGGAGSYLIKGGSFSMDGYNPPHKPPGRGTGGLDLNGTVTITGKDGAVLDAGAKGRLFCVGCNAQFEESAPTGGHLVLQGLTLRNGSSDGGSAVLAYGSQVTATDCTFSDNISPSGGGGAAVQGNLAASFTATRCTFTNNCNHNGIELFHGSNGTFTACTWTSRLPADQKCDNIVCNHNPGVVTFLCPAGTAGAPFVMNTSELRADQLPPRKEIVHCTPTPATQLVAADAVD
jgi:Leucine-rich repeat (LRR) protein